MAARPWTGFGDGDLDDDHAEESEVDYCRGMSFMPCDNFDRLRAADDDGELPAHQPVQKDTSSSPVVQVEGLDPWIAMKDGQHYCTLCKCFATEAHLESAKHLRRVELNNTRHVLEDNLVAQVADLPYVGFKKDDSGIEWPWCLLCKSWCDHGHLTSKKHEKRASNWQEYLAANGETLEPGVSMTPSSPYGANRNGHQGAAVQNCCKSSPYEDRQAAQQRTSENWLDSASSQDGQTDPHEQELLASIREGLCARPARGTIKVAQVGVEVVRILRKKVSRSMGSDDPVAHPEDNLKETYHFALYIDDVMSSSASIFLQQSCSSSKLLTLVTLPELQGCGLGSFLLKECLRLAREFGAYRLWCEAPLEYESFFVKRGLRSVGPGNPVRGKPYVILGNALSRHNTQAAPQSAPRPQVPQAVTTSPWPQAPEQSQATIPGSKPSAPVQSQEAQAERTGTQHAGNDPNKANRPNGASADATGSWLAPEQGLHSERQTPNGASGSAGSSWLTPEPVLQTERSEPGSASANGENSKMNAGPEVGKQVAAYRTLGDVRFKVTLGKM